MKPSVEAFADFTSWWGSADPSGGVKSAIRRFTDGSVSVMSAQEYESLKDLAREAKDEDKGLLEKWIETVRLAVTEEGVLAEACDLRLIDFKDSTLPLEACMESDKYLELASYRANPLSDKDTPELFFWRKFQHLLSLSTGFTFVDRYFGANLLKDNSGAQFFFREASRLGVSMQIWTSNPDPKRKFNYDPEVLESSLAKVHKAYSTNSSKVELYGVGGPGDPLMHDRMGYIKFFKGRINFELGQGLEILASRNFDRKLFQPAALNVGTHHEPLDRYLGTLKSLPTTRKIFWAGS